ncbi:MAG: BrnT family toxin [Nitrospirae bacterium]|nr:BrnT family toxin [Nitrospirota bacterium]
MDLDWDPKKSDANRTKHGIDFETAKELWQDENRVEIRAPHPVEDRAIVIARRHQKPWTGIYAVRGATLRIISERRARKREVALYEKEATGSD